MHCQGTSLLFVHFCILYIILSFHSVAGFIPRLLVRLAPLAPDVVCFLTKYGLLKPRLLGAGDRLHLFNFASRFPERGEFNLVKART